MRAAELGANDVEDRGNEVGVYTDVSTLSKIKDGLAGAGFQVVSSEISLKPKNKVEVVEELKDKIVNFLSALEDMDDVQKVYSNISF